MAFRFRALSIVAGLGFLAGCGRSDMASVTGRVTCNGKPVGAAMIAFNPVPRSGDDKNPGKPASAPRPAKRAAPADPVLFTTGAGGAQVRELQARLRKLQLFDRNPTGYYGSVTAASVRSFQRQQGMSEGGAVTSSVWAALRARTTPPSHAELYPPTTRPLDTPDPRCLTGRALCVSKKSRTLAWYVNGRMLSAMDVRFGSAYTPTREGKFSVGFKSRDHVSTIYDTPMPYALFFSGGQAIHYSSDFAARGYSGASHGCVNVRDKKKIAALFAQVRKGDKVVVYK